MFTIFETLFLLAIDDQAGDILESAKKDLEPALASAVLAELVLLGRVQVHGDFLTVVDLTSTDNPVLDHAMRAIRVIERSRKVKYWINTLVYEKLRARVGLYLVKRGLLEWKEKHLVQVLPFEDETGDKTLVKYFLKNHLRSIVLAGLPPDQTSLIQLLLLQNSNLLPLVFTRGERKVAEEKILQLNEPNQYAPFLYDAICPVIAAANRSLN